MSMSDDGGLLQDAVNEKSVPKYMSTFSELREYYREHYKSNQWIGKLAQDISGSETRSGNEYKAARRTLERHNTGQYVDFSKSSKYGDKIKEIGESLPSIGREPKEKSITITVQANQDGRERSWSITMTGPSAYDFVNNPTYRKFFVHQGYPGHVIDTFEEGDYELAVMSVS